MSKTQVSNNEFFIDQDGFSCTNLSSLPRLLSIAGLDLLQVLHTRMDSIAAKDSESQHLLNCWLPILEAISEPAEKSRNGV